MLTYDEATALILASSMSEEDTWEMILERCPDMEPDEFFQWWNLKKFRRKVVIQ